MKFSVEYLKEINFLNHDRVVTSHGRGLLVKMIERAEAFPEYNQELIYWLHHAATIKLRELALPWGKYFDDLHHANAIDELDTAHLHLTQVGLLNKHGEPR